MVRHGAFPHLWQRCRGDTLSHGSVAATDWKLYRGDTLSSSLANLSTVRPIASLPPVIIGNLSVAEDFFRVRPFPRGL
jgi:hypothetical protein